MRRKKLSDGSSLMPAGAIHVQPDRQAGQAPVQMAKDLEKPCAITALGWHHPVPAQQGSHPPREGQPLAMLAAGGHPQPLPDSRPPATHARVQGEPRFVLEDHRLLRPQAVKFFLTPVETAWPGRLAPADRYNWPASVGSPTDASNAGPAARSVLLQIAALGAPPRWGHPTGREEAPMFLEASLNEPPMPSAPCGSAGSADPAGVGDSRRRHRPGSPRESSGSNSCASGLRHRLSSPAVAPRAAATGQQPLDRPKPQECSSRRPRGALWWPRHASQSTLGFSWSQVSIVHSYLSHYLCRLY